MREDPFLGTTFDERKTASHRASASVLSPPAHKAHLQADSMEEADNTQPPSLSDDNLFQVFATLAQVNQGGDELARCALVCRQWKNVIDSDLLWRDAFKANYPMDYRWGDQNSNWKSKYASKRRGEQRLSEASKSTLKVVAINQLKPRIVMFQAVAPRNPERVVVKHRGGRMARLERRRDPEEEAKIIEDGNIKKFDWNDFEERKWKKEQEEGVPCPQFVYSGDSNKPRHRVPRR